MRLMECIPLWQGARCVCVCARTICAPRLKACACHSSVVPSVKFGVCQPFGHPGEDGAGSSETPIPSVQTNTRFETGNGPRDAKAHVLLSIEPQV